MPKYDVTFSRRVWQDATVTVEADSEGEAIESAEGSKKPFKWVTDAKEQAWYGATGAEKYR